MNRHRMRVATGGAVWTDRTPPWGSGWGGDGNRAGDSLPASAKLTVQATGWSRGG